MTEAQKQAVERIRRRCSIRGIIEYRDGTIQVGFESTATGRDREGHGKRLETRNTYEYA